MTSTYERIKNECKRKNILWEDPDFPAIQTSVFYHQTPPFTFQWKRPHELNPNPIFVNDSNAYFDIVPGKMGDRWFVSCLGILYLSKGLFYRVVPADQTFDQPYYGVFRFRIWWCGEWQEVIYEFIFVFLTPITFENLNRCSLTTDCQQLTENWRFFKHSTRTHSGRAYWKRLMQSE
jgi:hypothetical protein